MKKLVYTFAVLAIYILLAVRVKGIYGWSVILTSALPWIILWLSNYLMSSRKILNDEIVYNPWELPKYIGIFVSILIGYFLFTQINEPTISRYDIWYGYTYLLVATFLPLTYISFKVIRDRNDYIILNNKSIRYRDNKDLGEIKIEEINNIEVVPEGIKILLKSSKIYIIKTQQMNFNKKDQTRVASDMNNKISHF